MRIAAVAWFFWLIMWIATSYGEARECGRFEYKSGADHLSFLEYGVAKVYRESDGAFQGAATVFDARAGLLVTARHVVKDPHIFVVFSASRSSTPYKAEVITPASDAASDTDSKLDIAVIKVSSKPSYLNEAELWIAEIEENEKYSLYGYTRDRVSPLHASERLAWQGPCHYEMRVNTYPGDSGSPVFSDQGLLVGMVITASESGNHGDAARGIATVLPISCGLTSLKATVNEADVRNAWKCIRDTSSDELRILLSPGNKDKDSWIDNFTFAQSIDLASTEGSTGEISSDKRLCPIIPALLQRKIGLQRLDALMTYKNGTKKQKAELLHREANSYSQAGDLAAERTLLRASIAMYEGFLEDDPATTASITNEKIYNAQAYKGLADAQLRLAKISGDDPVLTEKAVDNSKLAAILAPAGYLRGAALATYASAKAELGQYDDAIAFYSAAYKNGFTASWVKNNYLAAFEERDNITDLRQASDYAPIGAYESRFALPTAIAPQTWSDTIQ